MVVHQLFESVRPRRSQPLCDEGAAANPLNAQWVEKPSWTWLVWLMVRLSCLMALAVVSLAALAALLLWLFRPRPTSRQRAAALLHTLVHCAVGVCLPTLGLALLVAAPGWARTALRATALRAIFLDRRN